MPYGDSGIDQGQGFPFAQNFPFTHAKIIGMVGGVQTTYEKQSLLDTGAPHTALGGVAVKNFTTAAQGVLKQFGMAGVVGLGMYKGVTVQYQAIKAGNPVDVKFTGTFFIFPAVKDAAGELVDPLPPMLGVNFFTEGGLTLTLNYPAQTCEIKQ